MSNHLTTTRRAITHGCARLLLVLVVFFMFLTVLLACFLVLVPFPKTVDVEIILPCFHRDNEIGMIDSSAGLGHQRENGETISDLKDVEIW